MSEPVIKAKAWMCPVCGRSEPRHFKQHRSPMATWCISDVGPLYGPDDLVRVAEASRQMAWVQVYNELKSPTIVFEETPSEVVDRLTKGDV